MDIREIVNITSRAWSLTILTLLHNGVAGRQAALLQASGASRTTFVNSLNHLITLGLLERNPGHGHPLRPEFRLTLKGAAYAAAADKITTIAPAHTILRRTWTVPVLAIGQQPRFFGEMKAQLGPITDRALSHTLKELQTQNWITRSVDVTLHPPRAAYVAANEGMQISQALGAG